MKNSVFFIAAILPYIIFYSGKAGVEQESAPFVDSQAVMFAVDDPDGAAIGHFFDGEWRLTPDPTFMTHEQLLKGYCHWKTFAQYSFASATILATALATTLAAFYLKQQECCSCENMQ